jgi:hypothetical protein
MTIEEFLDSLEEECPDCHGSGIDSHQDDIEQEISLNHLSIFNFSQPLYRCRTCNGHGNILSDVGNRLKTILNKDRQFTLGTHKNDYFPRLIN